MNRIGVTMIRFLPLLGKRWVYEIAQVIRQFEIVDPLNWIGLPISFPPNLFFVFFAYFIRAYLRGACFGTRLNGGKHGPVIVLVMARVRQQRRNL